MCQKHSCTVIGSQALTWSWFALTVHNIEPHSIKFSRLMTKGIRYLDELYKLDKITAPKQEAATAVWGHLFWWQSTLKISVGIKGIIVWHNGFIRSTKIIDHVPCEVPGIKKMLILPSVDLQAGGNGRHTRVGIWNSTMLTKATKLWRSLK